MDISTELRFHTLRKRNLRKTFDDIESQFDFFDKSISKRQNQLLALEDSLRNQMELIKVREKRLESFEESVNLRFKEVETREVNEKRVFEERAMELELMTVSVEQRSREVDLLRAELDEGLCALESKEKQFRLFEKSVNDKSKELEIVRDSIKESLTELDLKEKDADAKLKELDSAQNSIQESSRELDRKEEQFKLLKESADAKSKELETVQNSIDERFKELNLKEEQLKLLEESVDAKSKELETVQNSIDEGFKELNLKEEQLKLLEKSVDAKSKELEIVQNSIKEGFKELNLKEEQLRLLDKSVDAKTKELDYVRNSIDESSRELAWKEEQFKLFEKSVDVKSEKLEIVKFSLNERLKKLDSQEEQLGHEVKSVNAKSKELEIVRNSVNKRSIELNLKEEQLRLLNSSVDAKSKELETVQNSINERICKLDSKEKQLDAKEKYVEECKMEIELREKQFDMKINGKRPLASRDDEKLMNQRHDVGIEAGVMKDSDKSLWKKSRSKVVQVPSSNSMNVDEAFTRMNHAEDNSRFEEAVRQNTHRKSYLKEKQVGVEQKYADNNKMQIEMRGKLFDMNVNGRKNLANIGDTELLEWHSDIAGALKDPFVTIASTISTSSVNSPRPLHCQLLQKEFSQALKDTLEVTSRKTRSRVGQVPSPNMKDMNEPLKTMSDLVEDIHFEEAIRLNALKRSNLLGQVDFKEDGWKKNRDKSLWRMMGRFKFDKELSSWSGDLTTTIVEKTVPLPNWKNIDEPVTSMKNVGEDIRFEEAIKQDTLKNRKLLLQTGLKEDGWGKDSDKSLWRNSHYRVVEKPLSSWTRMDDQFTRIKNHAEAILKQGALKRKNDQLGQAGLKEGEWGKMSLVVADDVGFDEAVKQNLLKTSFLSTWNHAATRVRRRSGFSTPRNDKNVAVPLELGSPVVAFKHWTLELVQKLLEFILTEQREGRCTPKNLTSEGYTNVSKKFEKIGIKVTPTQLRRKYGELQKDFILWKKLKQCDFRDCPNDEPVKASEGWWQCQLEADENVGRLRSGLPLCSLMYEVFQHAAVKALDKSE